MSMLNIPPATLPPDVATGQDLLRRFRSCGRAGGGGGGGGGGRLLPRPASRTKAARKRQAGGRLRIFHDGADLERAAAQAHPALDEHRLGGSSSALSAIPTVLHTESGTPRRLDAGTELRNARGWAVLPPTPTVSRPVSRAAAKPSAQALIPAISTSMSVAMTQHIGRVDAEMGADDAALRAGLETWPSSSGMRGANAATNAKLDRGAFARDQKDTRAKPTLLRRLEQTLEDELALAHGDDARLRAHQEIFDVFIDRFGSYRPLLQQVKAAYDDRVGLCAAQQEYIASLETQLAVRRDEEFARIEQIEAQSLQAKRSAQQRANDATCRYEDLWLKHKALQEQLAAVTNRIEDTDKKCAAAVAEKKRFASAIDQLCDINNNVKQRYNQLEEAHCHMGDIFNLKENVLLTEMEKAGLTDVLLRYNNTHWGAAMNSKQKDDRQRPGTPENVAQERNMSAVINMESSDHLELSVLGDSSRRGSVASGRSAGSRAGSLYQRRSLSKSPRNGGQTPPKTSPRVEKTSRSVVSIIDPPEAGGAAAAD